jgi:hypothetical protein
VNRPSNRDFGNPRFRKLALLSVLGSLFVLGCTRAEPQGPALGADAAADAQAVIAHQGSAGAISAQAILRVKPSERDAIILTINLWSPPDGRIRLSASKVGVSGMEALIGTDGSLVAIPRDGEVVRDRVATAFANVLGPDAHPARLIEDLKVGPLPLAKSYERTATGLACIDPGTGLRVAIDLAADGVTATRKTWFAADGSIALAVAFDREQNFEGLQRATRWTFTIPNWKGECQLRLQKIDVVPMIGEDRLRLDVPADAKVVDAATFLETMTDG